LRSHNLLNSEPHRLIVIVHHNSHLRTQGLPLGLC
jgi:hypothetical protein